MVGGFPKTNDCSRYIISFKTYDDKLLQNVTQIIPSTYISPIYPGLHHHSSFVTLNLKFLLVDSCSAWIKSGMVQSSTIIHQNDSTLDPHIAQLQMN